MTIGIAIPTYKNHINNIENLLDIISKSTILPKQVSISISSINQYVFNKKYPFELISSVTNETKNPSQNRNTAASKLQTDIISFIDGDDLPHPQRNEFLLEGFKIGSECIVHDYIKNSILNNNFFNIKYDNPNLFQKYIDTVYYDTIYPRNSLTHLDYHCAHISITKKLFDNFKFDERESIKFQEDSYYCRTLVENNHFICYLNNKLSQYIK